MYCSKCGKQIGDNSKFCEYCGNEAEKTENITTAGDIQKERMGILELIAGFIPICFTFLVLYFLGDDIAGLYLVEILYIMCTLTGGIVGIATRKNADKWGAITAGVIYLSGIFISLGGTRLPGYTILGLSVLICSAVFFYCAFRRNKINAK